MFAPGADIWGILTTAWRAYLAFAVVAALATAWWASGWRLPRRGQALAMLLAGLLAGCSWVGDGVPTPGSREATRSTRGAIYASPPRLEIRARSGLSGVAVASATVTIGAGAEWSAAIQGADFPAELRLTLLAPEGSAVGAGPVKVRARWTSRLPPGDYRADVVVRTADGREALRLPVIVTTED